MLWLSIDAFGDVGYRPSMSIESGGKGGDVGGGGGYKKCAACEQGSGMYEATEFGGERRVIFDTRGASFVLDSSKVGQVLLWRILSIAKAVSFPHSTSALPAAKSISRSLAKFSTSFSISVIFQHEQHTSSWAKLEQILTHVYTPYHESQHHENAGL